MGACGIMKNDNEGCTKSSILMVDARVDYQVMEFIAETNHNIGCEKGGIK